MIIIIIRKLIKKIISYSIGVYTFIWIHFGHALSTSITFVKGQFPIITDRKTLLYIYAGKGILTPEPPVVPVPTPAVVRVDEKEEFLREISFRQNVTTFWESCSETQRNTLMGGAFIVGCAVGTACHSSYLMHASTKGTTILLKSVVEPFHAHNSELLATAKNLSTNLMLNFDRLGRFQPEKPITPIETSIKYVFAPEVHWKIKKSAAGIEDYSGLSEIEMQELIKTSIRGHRRRCLVDSVLRGELPEEAIEMK